MFDAADKAGLLRLSYFEHGTMLQGDINATGGDRISTFLFWQHCTKTSFRPLTSFFRTVFLPVDKNEKNTAGTERGKDLG